MKKKIVIFGIICMFVLVGLMNVSANVVVQKNNEKISLSIDSDEDFKNCKYVSKGIGTYAAPYVIEYLDFNDIQNSLWI